MTVEKSLTKLDHRPREVVLRARDIWFNYDGVSPILQGASIEVREGLITMMLGRSGSGKSTFLKILAGLITPTAGEVRFSAAGSEVACGQARGVAYIPQNLGLVRGMTVLENVLMGALGQTGTMRSLFKIFPRRVERRAREILGELGIVAKIEKKVWSLSGGERQRVAIARALIQNPRVILADEFVSQLDPLTSMEILALMKSLADARTAFLMSTHDVDLVGKYADRVVFMKQGQISAERCPAVLVVEDILEEMA